MVSSFAAALAYYHICRSLYLHQIPLVQSFRGSRLLQTKRAADVKKYGLRQEIKDSFERRRA